MMMMMVVVMMMTMTMMTRMMFSSSAYDHCLDGCCFVDEVSRYISSDVIYAYI